jgi:hypothetical protein
MSATCSLNHDGGTRQNEAAPDWKKKRGKECPVWVRFGDNAIEQPGLRDAIGSFLILLAFVALAFAGLAGDSPVVRGLAKITMIAMLFPVVIAVKDIFGLTNR